MKNLSLLCSLLLCLCYANAQNPDFPELAPNLVPNPSFEKVKKGIDLSYDEYKLFRYYMQAWESPTLATPDLIGVNPHRITEVKDNNLDVDIPRTGNRCVAIITDNPNVEESVTDMYREYIQVRLTETLKAGETYHVEFWARKSHNAKLISNNLGAFFSPARHIEDNHDPLLLKPFLNYKQRINKDKSEWIKISGEFTPEATIDYMIIGNFFDNSNTIVEEIRKEGWNNAYYLIDDVNVYQTTNINQPEPEPIVEIEKETSPDDIENIKVEVGKTIQLRNIFFETAKWDLLPASFVELNKLVNLLNKYPTMQIAIHGHTDSRGGRVYNQKLSENRAGAVRQYLIDNSIESGRLSFAGFGLERPMATNDTAEGRQLNRRVEFVIVKE